MSRFVIGAQAVLAIALSAGTLRAQEACPTGDGLYTVLSFAPSRPGTGDPSVVPTAIVVDGIGEVRVRPCNSHAVLMALKEGRDLEGLLNRKIILAIVESGTRIEHYVVPHMLASREGGALPSPPSFAMCGEQDFRSKCEKYRKQLEAIVTTAIALYEAKKSADDPCRDPRKLTTTIHRAQAALAPFLSEPSAQALQESLRVQDNLLTRATARGCGPRPLNQKLIAARIKQS